MNDPQGLVAMAIAQAMQGCLEAELAALRAGVSHDDPVVKAIEAAHRKLGEAVVELRLMGPAS